MSTRYGLEIRTATAADASGLCALLKTLGHIIEDQEMARRLEAMRQAAGTALIAVEWGPPSGIVVMHWYHTPEAALPVAQITSLFVAPDDRRRGLGRLLVKAASQAARVANCGALELTAATHDSALAAFCLSTGFAEAGARYVRPLRKKILQCRPESRRGE